MNDEIEEEISKNLIIYLNHHGCSHCLKPYSNKTLIEIDDLSFIFSGKWFYKLDCSVSKNKLTVKRNYHHLLNHSFSLLNSPIIRTTISLLKPSLHDDVSRFNIVCINCWNSRFLEYNLNKLRGTKNYLK